MRFMIAMFASFVGCSMMLSANEPSSDSFRLRVMTYNVMGGRNTDASLNVDRIAEVIRKWDPDIVSLQEVDRKTTRFKGVDLAAELAHRLQMHHAFGEALALQGGGYGQAVLSRWPITRSLTHALPGRDGVEPRCALEVEITPLQSVGPVRFIATHFDHKADDTDRLMQLAKLLQLFPATVADTTPTILAGDINAEPGSPTLTRLEAVWADVWPSGLPTHPSQNPNRRIDYIFTHKATPLLVLGAWRGDELPDAPEGWARTLALASDHLPVISDFKLPAVKLP